MRKLCLFLAAAFLVASAYSQDDANKKVGKYTASGGILGAMNMSELAKKDGSSTTDYTSNIGPTFGVWLNIPLGLHFSLEPQLLYSTYHYETKAIRVFTGRINYVSLPILMKLATKKVFAFTLGPQFDFISSVKDDSNLGFSKSNFKSPSVAISGGLEIFPHARLTAFGRYIYGLNDFHTETPSGSNFRNASFHFGFKLKLFGHKKEVKELPPPPPPQRKDTDGDGIYDDEDKCPTVPGIAKYQGCPIPDTDGDGINDEEDKCPTVPGLRKYQGCPIPDTDGDGINDEEDKCPTVPGLRKYQGCPPPDRDGDGVIDDEDRCPDTPGVKENYGCPEISAEVKKKLDYAAKNVYFNTNSTKLLPKSFTSLNDVVKIMSENPSLKLKIDGHTDSQGSDEFNLKLSDGRAASVKEYLVSKGVSEDRLSSEGFGESQPIADNNTAAGRAKNRRVEMKPHY
ncbi:MAG: OmpA family protein [Chitinophagaceae bacterium]